MKAAVFHKPGTITCDNIDEPFIKLQTIII